MYSVNVCTTDDRELPAPELGLGLNWDRLTEILRREISPEVAELLAEPIAEPARGQTHWHVSASEDPRLASELDDGEREKLLAVLAERRGAILKLADRLAADGSETNARLAAALRTIVDVPDPDRHVWSVAGRPVLSAWGRSTAASRDRRATIVTRGEAPKTEAAALSGVVVGVTPAVEPANIQKQPPRIALAGALRLRNLDRWRSLPLWLLLAAILLAILYRLLPACSVNLPLVNRPFGHCERRADSRLDLLREENQGLRDSIGAAELKVAAVEGDCAPPRVDNQLQPRQEDADRPDAIETEERRRRAQGTEGVLDITLAWNGREDLDLHVVCPGGEIWSNIHNACGGMLDVDRNSKIDAREDNPVEHVTWVTDPPPGDYRIFVVLYNRFELPPRDVPFTVVVRDGGDRKVFSGVGKTLKYPEPVTQFRR
jgi:hypothetical protein